MQALRHQVFFQQGGLLLTLDSALLTQLVAGSVLYARGGPSQRATEMAQRPVERARGKQNTSVRHLDIEVGDCS